MSDVEPGRVLWKATAAPHLAQHLLEFRDCRIAVCVDVWAHLCRAEKVRGPDGPLAEPERVAIKQLKGSVSQTTLEQTQQEAHIMRRLSGGS